jgi:hypothetical protein
MQASLTGAGKREIANEHRAGDHDACEGALRERHVWQYA